MPETKRVRVALLLVGLGIVCYLFWYLSKDHIHDLPTFSTVVVIAFIQALVVIGSALLAIAALPLPEAGESREAHNSSKTTYIFGFSVFGFLLFLATCYVGVLNDKAQYEAKTTVEDLQSHLIAAATSLDEIHKCQQTPGCTQATQTALTTGAINRLPRQFMPQPHDQPTPPLAQPTPASAPKLSDLTNDSLKAEVISFATKLRTEVTDLEAEQKSRIGDVNNPTGADRRERDSSRDAIRNQLRRDADSQIPRLKALYFDQTIAYETELYRRLNRTPDGMTISTVWQISPGFLVLENSATRLENLANALPAN